MAVPAAVSTLGICALGRPASPVLISRRLVHSPAPIRTSATMAPSRTRAPGPNQPCSIAWRTRKKPPSASAMPPAQTTHCVPKRSSRLALGLAGFGTIGGVTGVSGSGGGGAFSSAFASGASAGRGSQGRRGRNRGGRRRFARKPGELRFDPSKVELETLQPLAIAERHDETDDGEHRKGDHHGDESGEERVHQSGWGKKPMEGSRPPQSVRRSSVAALRPMVEASPVGRPI